MRRTSLAFALVAAAVAPACLLLTDTGDLATGTPDSALGPMADANDAGIVPDDGIADATVVDADAAVVHADGAIVDSGQDSHFACKSLNPKPTFCDDFDENPLGFDWIRQEDWGGTLSLDDAGAASAPFALLSTLPAVTSGYPVAGLARAENTLAGRVRVAFDIKIGGVTPNQGLQPLRMVFKQQADARAGLSAEMNLYATPTQVSIDELLTYSDGGEVFRGHALSRFLIVDRWTHIDFDADFDTLRLKVWFDGVSVLDEAILDGYSHMMPTLFVGSRTGGDPPYPAHNVRIDNVVLDLK